jgi:hypothetical protein
MKPLPCFEVNKDLEEAAREAEQRKNRAIERLRGKLIGRPPVDGQRFERMIVDMIEADKRALKERGR